MKEKLKAVFKSRAVWAGVGAGLGILFPKFAPVIQIITGSLGA